MTKPQIILVDDDNIFLKPAVGELIRAFPDCEIVGLTSEKMFQKHVASTHDSDIGLVIADALLAPPESGADVLLYCRQRIPHVRRVLMSNKASREDLEDAINRCALDGYIEKFHPLRQQELGVLKRLLLEVRTAEPVNDLAASKTIEDLEHITPGLSAHAHLYKNTIRDLMAFAFYPWLQGPRSEVQIQGGTSRIDILFRNAADKGVFADLKQQCEAIHVPVETKNTEQLCADDFHQLNDYLNDPVGRWGILCFRGCIEKKDQDQVKAARRKKNFVMLLTDSELVELCRSRFSERQSRADYEATLAQFVSKKLGESIG
jgi:hypothetical protein